MLSAADVMGFGLVMLVVNVQVIAMLLQVLFEKMCGIKVTDCCKCLACILGCGGKKRDLSNLREMAREKAEQVAEAAREKASGMKNKIKPV
jgi:hypothetical protein